MGANQNPLSFLSQAGMGDFGLTQDSNTNSNAAGSEDGANTVDLQDMLGSSILDAEEKARLLGEYSQGLGIEGGGGMKDQLFSKRGLLLAALAGGSLAAGQPGLAAGIGLGGIEKGAENVAAERTALKAAKDQAEAERDKALQRADSERNRLANMFNTNPEAFVNPETGEPVMDDQAFGYLLTGQNVAIHPTTRRVMNRRDKDHERVTEIFMDSLEEAQSVEQAGQIVTQLFNHLGDAGNVPPAVKDALVRAYGTPEFDKEFASTVFRYAGASGRDAAIKAGELGLPLHHPTILKMMDFSKGDAITPSQQLNSEYIKLRETVRLFQMNPENATILAATREETNNGTEFNRALVEMALPLGADQDLYFDKANLIKDGNFDQFQEEYNNSMGQYNLLATLGQIDSIDEYMSLDGEGKREFLRNLAASTANSTHATQLVDGRQQGTQRVLSTIAAGAATLISEFNISEPVAGHTAQVIYAKTREYLQGENPEATLEEIQAEFDLQIQKRIQEIKDKQ